MKAIWSESMDGIFSPIFWDVPEDLRHFKEKTFGGSVVMGRGTWESIGRKPLKGRRNLVVTSSALEYSEGGDPDTEFIPRLSDAPSDAWVIGGAALIDEAFDAGFIDEFYVTYVGVFGRDSDTWNAPDCDAMDEFEVESTVNATSVTGVGYTIDHYVRPESDNTEGAPDA